MDYGFSDSTPFDTRTKELLGKAIPTLLRLLIHIEPSDPLEWIAEPNENPLTIHRRADFVVRNLKTGQFLQVELQSQASNDLLKRCVVYGTPYFFHFGIFPNQYVLHLGSDRANYDPVEYQDGWHSYRIEVIDMKELPADDFLHTDVPEVVVLAILCAAESPEHLVEEILIRLRELVLDTERLADYISILDTLGGLRDLNHIIKDKSNHMALHFDKTKTFLFNDGKIEGKAEGIQEGLEKGIQQGEEKKLIELVQEMYAEGDMTLAKIARVCHITEDRVREILNLSKA
jgi:predicted transposase YdaD